LAYPDFSEAASEFVVDCDASSFGIGACLGQVQSGTERIVSFASKTLTSSQKNYSVYERELLAVVTFLGEFRHYLLGKRFTVRTDHQALKWLFSLPDPRGRRARWLEILAEYDFVIVHRPGREHANADSLSRKAAGLGISSDSGSDKGVSSDSGSDNQPAGGDTGDRNEISAPPVVQVSSTREIPVEGLSILSVEDMVEEQRKDPDLSVVIGWRGEDPHQDRILAPSEMSGVSREIQDLWVERESLRFVDHVLYRQSPAGLQLCVPRSLREKAVMSVHDAVGGGHFGRDKTLAKCRRRYYWPGLYTFVCDYVRACTVCQQAAKDAGGIAPLEPIVVGYPNEIVALDLVGPLPPSEHGNRYILVMIDYFTRWSEAIPLPNATAATVGTVFVNEWVSRYGAPEQLHSDQGTQFESKLFQQMCSLLSIYKTRTTPYHPQSDGRVERMNRTLTTTLRAYAHDHPNNWDGTIPLALLPYRSAEHRATGETPFRMLAGREMRLPADVVFPRPEPLPQTTTDFVRNLSQSLAETYDQARLRDQAQHKVQKDTYDKKSRGSPFVPGDMVWLLDKVIESGMPRKLHWPWTGPYVVIRQINEAVYDILSTGAGKRQTVHFNRLKRCVLPASSRPPGAVPDVTNPVEDDPPEPGPPPQPPPAADAAPANPRAHLARQCGPPRRLDDFELY